MDTNLGDALSGLLLLRSDSNNDSDDGSTTHISNESNVTPTSSNDGLTPTANAGSMDTAPNTPPAAEMKKRTKYKKRGSTSSFKQQREPNDQGAQTRQPVRPNSVHALQSQN